MRGETKNKWYIGVGIYVLLLLFICAWLILEKSLADLTRTGRPVRLNGDQTVEMQLMEDETDLYYYTDVDLQSGKYFELQVTFSQIDGENAFFVAQLVGDGETPYWVDRRDITEDTGLTGTMNIDYAHIVTPAEQAMLLVYVPEKEQNIVSDIQLACYDYVTGTDGLTEAVKTVGYVAISVSVCLIAYGLYLRRKYLKDKKESKNISINLRKMMLDRIEYFVVAVAVFVILLVIYRNADLNTPILHNMVVGDEKGYEYNTSMFMQGEMNLVNPDAGGIYGAEQFDYPFSEWIQAYLLAWIGSGAQTPYLVNNLFYFLCYFLNAFSAVWLCRKLQYRKSSSILISVLFAFSPYIQFRYEHLWLNGYFMIPVAVYCALCIVSGEAKDSERSAWIFVCCGGFLCAYTGLYYAFFTCILFSVAVVVRLLQRKGLSKEALALPGCILGVIMTIIPNLLYWHRCGKTAEDYISLRDVKDAEKFSLRLIQMVLPRENHRVGFLRELTERYEMSLYHEHMDWTRTLYINENISSAIGMIAVCGLVISVLWLLSGRKDDHKHTLATFNISLLLVATSGGIGVLFSFFVKNPARAYNRLSIWIMLISLLCFTQMWEKVCDRWKKGVGIILTGILLAIGVFDQTVDYQPVKEDHFYSAQSFYANVGNLCRPGESVFNVPYIEWPTYGNRNCLMGPTLLKQLHWGNPAMMGRLEANWQNMVSKQPTEQMLQMIVNAGYNGIIFDQKDYVGYENECAGQSDLEALKACLGEPMIADDTIGMYFWRLTY